VFRDWGEAKDRRGQLKETVTRPGQSSAQGGLKIALIYAAVGALWIIFGVLSLLPSLHLAQAKEGDWERLKEQTKIIKNLNYLKLGPEKEKAMLSIEERYGKERKDIVATMKKYQEDLKTALATADQDEAKIKDLVTAVSATQDKLLASFKMERDKAMALMNPVQQAQFIMAIYNWYQELAKKA
jgi:Spy/CpxP family protein refolding chaperone